MGKIDMELSVSQDPRFLHALTMDSKHNNTKFNNLESWIKLGREILNNEESHDIEIKLDKFINTHVNINKFEVFNHSDITTRYFIFILIRLLYNSQRDEFILFNFNFRDLYTHKNNDTSLINQDFKYLPILQLDSNYKKEENIVYIDNIINHYNMNINEQLLFIKRLADLIRDFKESEYYSFCCHENQSKSDWFLKKITNNTLQPIMPHPDTPETRRYFLAISLYLWNKNSDYTDCQYSLFSEVKGISKYEFISKANKSWNKIKHQEYNVKNKIKGYSFEMSTDITKKLNELSKYHDKKKNSLVQYLIEQAYDDMKRK